MKKNGFTLIELLITIAIIGILGVIAGGAIINSLGGAKEDINEVQEQMIISAAKLYVIDNPGFCVGTCSFFVDVLVESGYIEESEEVSGSISVTEKSPGKYSYSVNLASGDNSGDGSTSNYIDFDYTGEVQKTLLSPGTYKLEVWGAQGGNYNSGVGGKGGYSYGTLKLTSNTNLFVYVGEQPSSNEAGFNGGSATSSYGYGGGGASDVRIGQDSLYARVIVAGGGGSNGYSTASPGGYGGGTSGGTGTSGTYAAGGGGTQTEGGTSYNSSGVGTFGAGGYYSTNGGGAGGGWYGGGHGYGGSVDSAGGGGSGYVYTSSTASNYPSGCLLNSDYYLTNASSVAGNTSFTSPTGTNETGHTGHGYVRITKQ